MVLLVRDCQAEMSRPPALDTLWSSCIFGNQNLNEACPKWNLLPCNLSCLWDLGRVLSWSQTTAPTQVCCDWVRGLVVPVAWESSLTTSWKHSPTFLRIYGMEIEIRLAKPKRWAIKRTAKCTVKFDIAQLTRACYTQPEHQLPVRSLYLHTAYSALYWHCNESLIEYQLRASREVEY